MKQKYNHKQTHRQIFVLTTQSKQAIDKLVRLSVESVQKDSFIDYKFIASYESGILDTLGTIQTLQNDLYYQLYTSKHPYDNETCTFLIESLYECNFLAYSEKAYYELLHIQSAHFQKYLKLIQSFGLCSVGTYNQIEALILPCQHIANEQGVYLFTHHAQDIIDKKFSINAKPMKLSIAEVKDIILSLHSFSPYLCSAYQQTSDSLHIPDVEISIHEQELNILLIKLGSYSFNEQYLETMAHSKVLKTHFQEANILFKTIHKRNITLLKIVNELVQIQKGYFLYQEELNSCTLKDIALKLRMSESTISRSLSNKFYCFKGECYPFKKLFVSTNINGDSSDRIRKALSHLVEHEDKTKPLSDQQIVIKLSSMDIKTTRRTITKYRKLLNISSSTNRRKL